MGRGHWLHKETKRRKMFPECDGAAWLLEFSLLRVEAAARKALDSYSRGKSSGVRARISGIILGALTVYRRSCGAPMSDLVKSKSGGLLFLFCRWDTETPKVHQHAHRHPANEYENRDCNLRLLTREVFIATRRIRNRRKYQWCWSHPALSPISCF